MTVADKYDQYVGFGRKVPGYGPTDGSVIVMFVGEAPGAAEEGAGKPFVGKTGVEMKRLCRQAGIEWGKSWRTNVCKYRPFTRSKSGNVKPTAADVRRDEQELVDELEKIRPRFVVAVGAVAARWLLGGSGFGSMEDAHGFPFEGENWRARQISSRTDRVSGAQQGVGGRTEEASLARSVSVSEDVVRFTVIPIYHPASGLHQPENQPMIYWDFMQAGKYIRGELPLIRPIDEHPDPDYYEPRGEVGLVRSLPVAVDTEGLKGRVWGLSFSQMPGSAGVVRKTNKKALESIKRGLLS